MEFALVQIEGGIPAAQAFEAGHADSGKHLRGGIIGIEEILGVHFDETQ
ncbi:hypothetical protein [Thiobacillus sp.]